jgi:hypothetical protein
MGRTVAPIEEVESHGNLRLDLTATVATAPAQDLQRPIEDEEEEFRRKASTLSVGS